MSERWVVICYDDRERVTDPKVYVRATRGLFKSEEDAKRYATTVAITREAKVITLVDYLIKYEGWLRKMRYIFTLLIAGIITGALLSRLNELHAKLDRVNDLVLGRVVVDSTPPTPIKCELPPEQAKTEAQPKVIEEDPRSKTEAAPASAPKIEAAQEPTPTPPPVSVPTPEPVKPAVKRVQVPKRIYNK